ncbi:diphthamide biosynthesis protein-like protein [Corynespora cassiicola Philippines]|uniref:2-(3-amino-3-carboxypropyl)histidine synthase subunit 2 n=1 Tax=Corynespora cassiicola Philippines TaxID=1448308 RepID=A0A2T2P7H9_CORCC|nr:diphthamide biosynthesis protein-like protein [Corynespora cassiicola Philippines]
MTAPTAPALYGPEDQIFEDPTPVIDVSSLPRLSDEQVFLTYEIERTVKEIREGRWKRIALQFPDHMLIDAPRVYDALTKGLGNARKGQNGAKSEGLQSGTEVQDLAQKVEEATIKEQKDTEERLFILGDTSYGACCVDEVAAEHVDADVVVHYGRSCLSPPSRLPVIYVFTERPLDLDAVLSNFQETYPDKSQKTILMADIPYAHHIPTLHNRLQSLGYTHTHATEIVHNPSSLLPNRTVPAEASADESALRDYHLFHISDPPTSLLLTLASRVASTHIYPTSVPTPSATLASTAMTLRRRYALISRLASEPVFGILINTLSVKNYMHIVSHVQAQIAAAGKKHYTFVVGKVNAAKVANFSEVGGWVVIGCWESSLVEGDAFWKPVITPFELGVALQRDDERVWTGEWRGDFQALLDGEPPAGEHPATATATATATADQDAGYASEEESAPPEFDLRTGRYVSHSRPLHTSAPRLTNSSTTTTTSSESKTQPTSSSALAKRADTTLATVGGVVSPGAEFLRSQRTWQGLGSDYKDQDEEGRGEAAVMEEGRSGIARGYRVGEGGKH